MQRKNEKFNLNTNIAEIHSVHLTLNCGSHSFWPFFAHVFLNSSHTLCILYSLVLCELSLWIMDVMRGNISDLTRRRIHPSSGWSRVGVLCRWIFTFCNLSIKKMCKNLTRILIIRWPTYPWKQPGGSWRMFSRSSVRSRNVSFSNLRRGRRAISVLLLLQWVGIAKLLRWESCICIVFCNDWWRLKRPKT